MATERPILFSASMVRALLAGRKSQTRRTIRRTIEGSPYKGSWVLLPGCVNKRTPPCPYGAPGDLLWVRETWGIEDRDPNGEIYDKPFYRADFTDGHGYCFSLPNGSPRYQEDLRWRPCIHMPRKHSRITLRVDGTRLERLHDISEADAEAEGVEPGIGRGQIARFVNPYRDLWDRINGNGAWAQNPYVWVVSFSVNQGVKP